MMLVLSRKINESITLSFEITVTLLEEEMVEVVFPKGLILCLDHQDGNDSEIIDISDEGFNMLNLTIKVNEDDVLCFRDGISISIGEISGKKMQFGLEAPSFVKILRSELVAHSKCDFI